MTKQTEQNGRGAGQAGQPAKRMGRRSVEESRETRRALLNAAVLEFSEKGMNGARIDDIAARAGVTKGAIYTHFDSREALLVEACRSAMGSLRVLRFAEDADDLATFVREAARLLLAPEGETARMLISELSSSAMRSELIGDLIAEWHAVFVETITNRVPPAAGSPEAIAMAINVLFAGFSYIDVYQSRPTDPDEVLAIVDRLTAALLPDDSS